MRVLRLGMHGLPADDERLIRNMMRMFAHDPTFRWQLSDGQEFEVLIIDAKKIQDTKIKRSARTVLRLSDAPIAGDDHVLTRPLQTNAFHAWLVDAESALTQSRINSTQAPRDTAARQAQANHLPDEPKSLRFKLRSWPPTIMMHNDPMREQMAQLLSVDAFEVIELAQITGAPLTECQTFVRKLQLVGLLDLVTATRDTGPATLPLIDDDFAPMAALPVKDGFGARLGRLRDRLGI